MQKLKIAALCFILLFSLSDLMAFCGFYVAKTDASLFNNTSQVIIVRDGIQTVVTMSSDFKGEVKDFAMVVPVPEVLKKNQVRTVNSRIFTKADAYSAPRLVEYHDPRPCPYDQPITLSYSRAETKSIVAMGTTSRKRKDKKEYQVTIEEEFSVDEYDIVILSAKESDGLERWLLDNGYKIPEGAREVLEPYIKSKMKFFVVKVNLEKMGKSPTQTLNPIQITYNSNNFMLPIRLGMANANGDQDMLVYTFTKKGRVETTNYRTTKVPSNRDVPIFVKSRFGEFYKDLFERSWKKESKNSVWLEYAWDISATSPVKCDPCNSALFTAAELKEAGVWWVTPTQWNQYSGDLFLTRLHVRYNRKTFPQDLAFQITPNTENFQGRYILRNPAPGPFDCDEAKNYLNGLRERRRTEVYELAALTGWKPAQFEYYVTEYDKYLPLEKDDDGHGLNEETLPNLEVESTVKVEPDPLPADMQTTTEPLIVEPETETGIVLEAGPASEYVPSVIEKATEVETLTAKADSPNRKGWMVLPLILGAVIMVLGVSRKKKKI